MKKSYWVMKTPGSTTEWIKMNGKQFYEFINSPAGIGRCFADFGNCKVECSPEQYKDWKKDQNHSAYLRGFEDMAMVLSLDYWVEYLGDGEDISLCDTIIDPARNTENKALENIELQSLLLAIQSLPEDERQLINDLFFLDKRKSEQEIASSVGVSKQAINKRKEKILKKLKKLVVMPLKKQQQE